MHWWTFHKVFPGVWSWIQQHTWTQCAHTHSCIPSCCSCWRRQWVRRCGTEDISGRWLGLLVPHQVASGRLGLWLGLLVRPHHVASGLSRRWHYADHQNAHQHRTPLETGRHCWFGSVTPWKFYAYITNAQWSVAYVAMTLLPSYSSQHNTTVGKKWRLWVSDNSSLQVDSQALSESRQPLGDCRLYIKQGDRTIVIMTALWTLQTKG